MSVFYPPDLVERARANINKYPWAAAIQKSVVESAQPWMKFSDDQLWELMFGPTITRSWMVLSNGFCPSCKQGVPMYTWIIRALDQPWKVQCPHCKELFPKNDFNKFYRSGLDEHGVFDPKRADRSLLFNEEHPDPKDPLHLYGVDDGEGYLDGDKRWRFIGTYLIYGQWKQAVYGGIVNLAAAFVVTGDARYAHKAGILLDRVADLYPGFDFGKQGVVYEGPGLTGYVSTWHDACEEVREIALAYDEVFTTLKDDTELIKFLSEKAGQYKLDNPKSSFQDIQRNIDDRILRDTLNHPNKIRSNYPRNPISLATIKTVLGWPENREEVLAELGKVLDQASSVDGVTGEKGLAGYTSFTINGVGILLQQFAMLDANFLKDVLERHPRIHQMFRFHIDTHCLGAYYPQIGDTGGFAQKNERYVGVSFSKNPGIHPSMYSFIWGLYKLTGDTAFLQVLYRENDDTVDGLPYDLFVENPDDVQKAVANTVAVEGRLPELGSVNKQEWHLAILRSGKGKNARALWLDYDAGGSHGHMNGMALGLFAKGLDFMPDFGYKPVNYGGWGAPKARWYGMTASHNTVVVEGKDHESAAGKTTLWADGKSFHAVRASGPGLIGGKQFERTAVLADISEKDFYVIDIFRVAGGTDHARFLYSHFGEVKPVGLALQQAEDYGYDTQLRSPLKDPSPRTGWSVDWKIDDRRQYLPAGTDMHFKVTDLTTDAQAYVAEAWISFGNFNTYDEAWIPCLIARRLDKKPLASTFLAVMEPYEKRSNIRSIKRMGMVTVDGVTYPDPNVALEIRLADGCRDLFIAADTDNPLGLKPSRSGDITLAQKDWSLQLVGDMCWVRLDSKGVVKRVALCGTRALSMGDLAIRCDKSVDYIELVFDADGAHIAAGDGPAVSSVRLKNRDVLRKN